jgi:LytR cell envelope-related transcriptional attenuator
VPELIKEIGSYAGLVAFLGLALLALLYFSQARDVRRLREWAGAAPEVAEMSAMEAEELRKREEERAREEQRRREEELAEAEREARRQRRAEGIGESPFARFRERLTGRMPEPRYLAVIIGGVIVLGAAVTTAALGVLGGDSDDGGSSGSSAGRLHRSQIEVAVLNGTAVPGLAAEVGDEVESDGFELGAVTNSQSSFTRSVVMFHRGRKPEARVVGKTLRIRQIQLATQEIASLSAGADVSVVLGEDRADAVSG